MQDSIINLFDAKSYKELSYRVLNPIKFDATKRYPVILSLHGAGGKGSDNLTQIKDSKWVTCLAKNQVRVDYPAYIIAPQTTKLWDDNDLSKIKKIIKNLPSVDMKRIYVLGHSMGGHRTYVFIQLDPSYFAATAPSAGSGLPETEDFMDVLKIKDIPIWAFHGNIDPKCPY
jgi:predicted peptidase